MCYWYLQPIFISYSFKRQKKELQLLMLLKKIWMNQITNQKKYRYNFQGTLNPICSCGDEIETKIYYLIHFPNYLNYLDTLRQSSKYSRKQQNRNDSQISEFTLFGVSSNNNESNTCILNANIHYILATKRFDVFLADF